MFPGSPSLPAVLFGGVLDGEPGPSRRLVEAVPLPASPLTDVPIGGWTRIGASSKGLCLMTAKATLACPAKASAEKFSPLVSFCSGVLADSGAHLLLEEVLEPVS